MTAELSTLIEAVTLMTSDGRSDARWLGRVLELLADCVGADAGLVAIPAGRRWEIIRAGRDAGRGPERVVRPGPPRGLVARILAGEESPTPVRGVDPEWDLFHGLEPRHFAGIRLTVAEDTAGALGLWNPQSPETPLVLAAAGAALGAALRNRALVRRLEAEVITDDLTRVYNYRYLRLALRREVQRAARLGHPLALLMIDVDHLKEYNERFGHIAGSGVLQKVAEVLRAATREIDLLAKYGGDEFLIILPHTRMEGAMAAAERLRQAVEMTPFPEIAAGEMTCSIGLSVFPENGVSPEVLLAAADEALFAAKRAGRNQVATAPAARAA